jgi:hypothetical protein
MVAVIADDSDTSFTCKRVIQRAIVKAALARELTLSVNDGEETTLKHSKSFHDVMRALRTTDEDYLYLMSGPARVGE